MTQTALDRSKASGILPAPRLVRITNDRRAWGMYEAQRRHQIRGETEQTRLVAITPPQKSKMEKSIRIASCWSVVQWLTCSGCFQHRYRLSEAIQATDVKIKQDVDQQAFRPSQFYSIKIVVASDL